MSEKDYTELDDYIASMSAIVKLGEDTIILDQVSKNKISKRDVITRFYLQDMERPPTTKRKKV